MVEAIFFDHALHLEDEWSANDLYGMESFFAPIGHHRDVIARKSLSADTCRKQHLIISKGLLDAYRRGCEKLRGAAAWKVESRSREAAVCCGSHEDS